MGARPAPDPPNPDGLRTTRRGERVIGVSASTWVAALPIGAVALVVLLLPGWFAARLVGAGGFATLAVAPAISVTTLTIGGTLSGTLGIGWRPATLLGWTLVTWAVAALAGLALGGPGLRLRRSRRPSSRQDAGPSAPLAAPASRTRWASVAQEWLWPAIAVGIAAVGLAVAFLPVAGHPSSFPQQPDTIQHLGIVQWMLGRGDISTLHAGGFVFPSGTGFYPAGFHDVVVTVVQLCDLVGIGGATPVVGATMVSLATAAVVWPLGCVLLVRTLLGPGLGVTLATGVTATAFSAFPLWLMGYGVLWPNLLGYALVPAALARLVVAVAPARRGVHLVHEVHGLDTPGVHAVHEVRDGRWGAPRAAVLLVAGLPGIAIAHPNALITVAVLGVLVAVEAALTRAWTWRRERPRRAVGLVAGTLGGLVVIVIGYALVSQRMASMRESNPLGAEMSLRTAFGQAVLQSPRGAPPLHLLGAVVVVGAVALLWRTAAGRSARWVVAALAVTAALWVMVVGVDDAATRWFTWPWYNNPPRLAALVVVPAVVCAAAALSLPERLVRWWFGRRRAGGPTSVPGWATGVAVASAVLVPAGFVVATGGYVDQHREMIDRYWHPSTYRSWASDAELQALRELSRYIGPDDVTAANPWNGATYLYLVSGRELLIPSEKVRSPGDRALLAERLDDVGSDPEVCAAVRRQHVRFAITGGRPFSSGGTDWKTYPGIAGVVDSPAFSKVATAGPYTLWELTDCAGG
jgi:hypothetical protein